MLIKLVDQRFLSSRYLLPIIEKIRSQNALDEGRVKIYGIILNIFSVLSKLLKMNTHLLSTSNFENLEWSIILGNSEFTSWLHHNIIYPFLYYLSNAFNNKQMFAKFKWWCVQNFKYKINGNIKYFSEFFLSNTNLKALRISNGVLSRNLKYFSWFFT